MPVEILAVIVSLVGSALASSGIVLALRRIVVTLLSPQERAGRPIRQIIRDALTEPPEAQPTLEQRIELLSGTMSQAGHLLDEITNEINVRAEFARQKKEEAENAIAAASMHKEQLEALQRVLRKEVSQEGNRGLRAAIVLALLSFVLGSFVTILVTLFVHPLY